MDSSGPWTGRAESEERKRMYAQTIWKAELEPGELRQTAASPKYHPQSSAYSQPNCVYKRPWGLTGLVWITSSVVVVVIFLAL